MAGEARPRSQDQIACPSLRREADRLPWRSDLKHRSLRSQTLLQDAGPRLPAVPLEGDSPVRQLRDLTPISAAGL